MITLREEGLSYAKISEKTGVPKTTCFDIVKRDEERRELDSKTPYIASAPRSGFPFKMTRRECCHIVYLAKRSRRAALRILCRSITVRVSMKTPRGIPNEAGLQRRCA